MKAIQGSSKGLKGILKYKKTQVIKIILLWYKKLATKGHFKGLPLL